MSPKKRTESKGNISENATKLVEFDEAVRLLRTSRSTLYRWIQEGRLKGHKAGRQWRFDPAEIERFLKGDGPRVELRSDITPLLENLTQRIVDATGEEPRLIAETPAHRAVLLMIHGAHHLNASDIHLAATLSVPSRTPVAVLRYRVDGVLRNIAEIDMRHLAPLIEQWKIVSSCNPQEKARSQDGRLQLDVNDAPLDVRVNFLPAELGESLTARLIAEACIPTVEKLGFSPEDQEKLLDAIGQPNGLVIVCGPAGAGKTTTLYSCLSSLAAPERKILTAEDPVEWVFPWMTQIQVNPKTGMTFQAIAIAMLRSDPDVLMFGEIRDGEMLHIAQAAALTGHLVLATLQAEDTVSAVRRMRDLGAPASAIGNSSLLLVSQRLVRRLCPECRTEEEATTRHSERTKRIERLAGIDIESVGTHFWKSTGCPACGQIGYRGRILIAETLRVTPEMVDALDRDLAASELRSLAIRQGFATLAADGLRRASQGETSLDEVARVLGLR